VFTFGADPVFNEPGGNITGVSWFGGNLAAEKLELLLQRSTSSRQQRMHVLDFIFIDRVAHARVDPLLYRAS
jgi:hypothetical protein